MVSAGNRMVAGQVVGIDERTVQVGQGLANSVRLTVLDEGGALHAFDMHEISNVRFLDEHLKAELKHLFETLLSATRRDIKNLKLFARGEGERKLSISYVVECPVWKTSYRMALSDNPSEKPFLQGWALVDNPQDEDWTDVRLSLVSGLPISFTHDLYSPRYLKRKEIEVEREAAAGPVMTEASMEDYGESAPFAARIGGGGAMSFAPPPPPAPVAAAPSRRAQMAASQKVETVTQAVGELFEYRVEQPVSVLRNQSALVPIVGSPFEGERKLLYSPDNRKENPFAVVDFKNTTGLTLEGGPLTVFENDVYAGEAMLDTMSPDEHRLVPFAVDLSVEAKTEASGDETVTMDSLKEGIWTTRKACYSRTLYRFNNKSDQAKKLVIEHPIERGELVDTPRPVSETRSCWRFALPLPPRTTTEFRVSVRFDEETRVSLLHEDPTWLLSITAAARGANRLGGVMEPIQAMAAKLEAIQEQERRLQQRQREIVAGQTRLRENLASLSQSHDEARLRSRYVAGLEQQEDELARLETELKSLAEQAREQKAELRKQLGLLSFEQTFDPA